MRRPYSASRASSSRRAPGGTDCRRYVRKHIGSRPKLSLIRRQGREPARQRGHRVRGWSSKSGGPIVTSGDPTDHALAAIASIRDNAEDEAALQPQSDAERQAIAVIEDTPKAPEQPDGGTQFNVVPGPMGSIGLRWSMRRGH